MKPLKPKPRSQLGWAVERARLACKVGRDGINGEQDLPDGVTGQEWAVYNLLHAVEDVANAVELMDRGGKMNAEIVRAMDLVIGDQIFEECEVLTVKQLDIVNDGLIRIESECGWKFLGDNKLRFARILPDPLEVRGFWRVKAAKGVSGIFIDLPANFDTKSAAVLNAMTYNVGTVEIEHVRETILSREEVKP